MNVPKAKVYIVPREVSLRPLDLNVTAQGEEVVRVPEYEHVVDALREEIRNRKDEVEAMGRLAGALPEQTCLSAVLQLAREVEHYRKMRLDSPVLSDTSIAVSDHVPTSLLPAELWKTVGTTKIPGTGETVVAIVHPGAEGLLFVTEAAWDCYEDARRCSS